ncbi:unnamed protein product [Penicillium manginii]
MPGQFVQCDTLDINHDLIPENDDLCQWCWDDLLTASIDDSMPVFGGSAQPLEGFKADVPPFELAVQFNPETEEGDSGDLISSEVSSEHRLSDVCSGISSSNSEDDAFEQETLETDFLEQIANMITQTEEEEPLLVHTEISDVSSYSSDELGLPDSELEEFGFFMTPREIL